MSNDQLINLLTAGVVPLLGLIAGLFYFAMNRSDKRREEERNADERATAHAALTKQRYIALREQVSALINRCIRRLENVKHKAEQGNRDTEIIRLADEAIQELEAIQLPPLE